MKFDESIKAATTKKYYLCIEGLQPTGTITFILKAGQTTPEISIPGPEECTGSCCDLEVECPEDPSPMSCDDLLLPCTNSDQAEEIFRDLGGTYSNECGPIRITCISEEGSKCEGKVVRITNFGAFVELAEGIEGLIHVSEFDDEGGREKVDLKVDAVTSMKIIKLSPSERKIGLSIRALKSDDYEADWDSFGTPSGSSAVTLGDHFKKLTE